MIERHELFQGRQLLLVEPLFCRCTFPRVQHGLDLDLHFLAIDVVRDFWNLEDVCRNVSPGKVLGDLLADADVQLFGREEAVCRMVRMALYKEQHALGRV